MGTKAHRWDHLARKSSEKGGFAASLEHYNCHQKTHEMLVTREGEERGDALLGKRSKDKG